MDFDTLFGYNDETLFCSFDYPWFFWFLFSLFFIYHENHLFLAKSQEICEEICSFICFDLKKRCNERKNLFIHSESGDNVVQQWEWT